jgi:aminopeptidase N
VSAFATDPVGYDTVVYFKGAEALEAARQQAGAATFDAALRCYVRAHAWRVATTADVATALSSMPAAIAVLRKAGAIH